MDVFQHRQHAQAAAQHGRDVRLGARGRLGDPEYYKWTEWFFAQLFKHGLAYKKMSPVDWCPNCNTTLAREQVWGDDRHCERCGTPVIKKNLDQWYFRITKYADELLNFDGIDWPERVKTLQTNWIGKSEGAHVVFHSEHARDPIEVFTTRPDTLWGATFMVLAPEHPLVAKLTTPDRKTEVEEYVNEVTRRTEIERESTEKDKTGVFIGAYAINPVNGARIPIWIADYVLMTYGTGAIMAVPAHDERDFQFALKFGLPILPVIDRNDGLTKSFALGGTMSIGFARSPALGRHPVRGKSRIAVHHDSAGEDRSNTSRSRAITCSPMRGTKSSARAGCSSSTTASKNGIRWKPSRRFWRAAKNWNPMCAASARSWRCCGRWSSIGMRCITTSMAR